VQVDFRRGFAEQVAVEHQFGGVLLLVDASLALNGAYALFLEDLFHGAAEFAASYRREESFGLSQKLWQHWQSRASQLAPGDEYDLVDDFADMTGLRGWYEWQPDAGHHEITAEPPREGTTNAPLLKAKNQAAVMYFLDAFKRFDAMKPEQVREVALEIAMLGRNGLDYSSPDEKYELRSLPGRKCSGLQLMCLIFASFKRIAPEHDLQMDLHEPFLGRVGNVPEGCDRRGRLSMKAIPWYCRVAVGNKSRGVMPPGEASASLISPAGIICLPRETGSCDQSGQQPGKPFRRIRGLDYPAATACQRPSKSACHSP